MAFAVLLHNIRSSHNVGSIFRTSDAAGASHVYLSGYTPTPTDRFGRASKDIAKTALGAERSVAWSRHADIGRLLARLKKDGWTLVAVEQDPRAVDYRTFRPRDKSVYLFGNEVRGLSQSILDKSDAIVEIPMHGTKESLNVSVAAGIVLFSALKT